jgi:uroporphyrinogen-III synthase
MFFINTRPTDRAETLTKILLDQGVEVVELPLLELVPTPHSSDLVSLYESLENASAIVVVSPTAVELGMQYFQDFQNEGKYSHITWIAVGEKTAETLSKFGVESVVPTVETSEGMLQLPILNELQNGATVAFWRGEGGRQFMMDSLRNKGIHILNFVLYTRQCPAQSYEQIVQLKQQLVTKSVYTMVVSSEASWLNWLKLIESDFNILNKADFWVLGSRLEQILTEFKKKHLLEFKITKLTNLKTESILQQIVVAQGNQ